jgi:hypothetical protein
MPAGRPDRSAAVSYGVTDRDAIEIAAAVTLAGDTAIHGDARPVAQPVGR